MDETELVSYLSFSRIQAVYCHALSCSAVVQCPFGEGHCDSGCTAAIAEKSESVRGCHNKY